MSYLFWFIVFCLIFGGANQAENIANLVIGLIKMIFWAIIFPFALIFDIVRWIMGK